MNGFHKTKHFSTLCVGKLLSQLLTETVLDSMYHSLNIHLLSYDDLSWLQPVVCLRHAGSCLACDDADSWFASTLYRIA